MPTINVYLPEELFELVKANKSRIIQQALKLYQHQHPAPANPPPVDAPPAQQRNFAA